TGLRDTTDASGLYGFVITTAGSYQVKILTNSIPTGCGISTLQNQGSDDTVDSDFDPTTGLSQAVTIEPTSSGLTKDNPTIDLALINLCTKPAYTVATLVGTCNQNGANDDASLALTSVVNGDKAAISTAGASTFDGVAYASATTITVGSLTFSSLKHNTQYIIRIYNQKDDCFEDVVYTTAPTNCVPCKPQCLGITFVKN
nr:SdrD B-like domain-containing protein [Flectobacillus sp.]